MHRREGALPRRQHLQRSLEVQHSKRKTDKDDARPRGTEEFLGRDTKVSQSSMPRQRPAGPDPVNLFGAAIVRTLLIERLRCLQTAQHVHRRDELPEKSVKSVSVRGAYY
jgi:hypothetical protein